MLKSTDKLAAVGTPTSQDSERSSLAPKLTPTNGTDSLSPSQGAQQDTAPKSSAKLALLRQQCKSQANLFKKGFGNACDAREADGAPGNIHAGRSLDTNDMNSAEEQKKAEAHQPQEHAGEP